MTTTPPRTAALKNIPRSVWVLGLVSLFMDVSSEMIHALLPLYLVTVLGATVFTVGVIEGVAEATAMIVKIFAGALSDWLGRRKLLAAFGYGLAAFTKPVFPLATSIGWIMAARFIDRIGKGIRGAPRDALIADLTPEPVRGRSFGLRQSLDTVGAVLGPLFAIGLMVATGNSFIVVFWLAVLPAFVSFGLIAFAVKDPDRNRQQAETRPWRLRESKRLGLAFWAVVVVAMVLTLARFSEAFLILKARDTGLAVAMVSVVMVVMNIAYALSSYPAGALSDRIGRRDVLQIGLILLIAADLVLAFGESVAWALSGTVLWGLHMGFTQGVLATLVADRAPPDLRGTAFGVFNFAAGIATLLASLIAGALWDVYGAVTTFLAGAAFTVLALVGLLVVENLRTEGPA
jgi:MFS family permease